jgi:hypothetical protein
MVHHGRSLSAHLSSAVQKTFGWLATLQQTSCALWALSRRGTPLFSLPCVIFVYGIFYRCVGHRGKPYGHLLPRDGFPAVPYGSTRYRICATSAMARSNSHKISNVTLGKRMDTKSCARIAATSSVRQDTLTYSENTLEANTLKSRVTMLIFRSLR